MTNRVAHYIVCTATIVQQFKTYITKDTAYITPVK